MEIDVELEEEAKGCRKTYDGNVIHLNFNTKTRRFSMSRHEEYMKVDDTRGVTYGTSK